MRAAEPTEKCVLIVEDNPLNRKLFAAMVAAQGYRVVEAADGPRGLDLAHDEYPDLIIMDVNLHGMSGLEVTKILKQDRTTRDIPVIVTTAYGLSGDEAELRASGCDGFMSKPIAVAEFVELVEAFLMPAPPLRRYAAR